MKTLVGQMVVFTDTKMLSPFLFNSIAEFEVYDNNILQCPKQRYDDQFDKVSLFSVCAGCSGSIPNAYD